MELRDEFHGFARPRTASGPSTASHDVVGRGHRCPGTSADLAAVIYEPFVLVVASAGLVAAVGRLAIRMFWPLESAGRPAAGRSVPSSGGPRPAYDLNAQAVGPIQLLLHAAEAAWPCLQFTCGPLVGHH